MNISYAQKRQLTTHRVSDSTMKYYCNRLCMDHFFEFMIGKQQAATATTFHELEVHPSQETSTNDIFCCKKNGQNGQEDTHLNIF